MSKMSQELGGVNIATDETEALKYLDALIENHKPVSRAHVLIPVGRLEEIRNLIQGLSEYKWMYADLCD